MSNEKSPIIIMGMHRSGTTLITKSLEKLGLLVGDQVGINHESKFFYKINDWMFNQVNATWDNPNNFNLLDEHRSKYLIKVAEMQLRSISRYKYLGVSKALKYSNIKNLDIPWGWKNPTNLYTYEVWNKIFPNAKMIFIYRNPIDVANSLKTREENIIKNYKFNLKRKIKAYFLYRNLNLGLSLRVRSLEEGIKLWEAYMTKFESLQKNDNCLCIKYEEFLSDPDPWIRKMIEFSSLSVNENSIQKVINDIQVDRKYAFIDDKKLVELYRKLQQTMPLLHKYGYGEII